MEFIANALNGNFLSNILPSPDDEIDGVMAAIAYGSNFNDEKGEFHSPSPMDTFGEGWLCFDYSPKVSIGEKWKMRSNGTSIGAGISFALQILKQPLRIAALSFRLHFILFQPEG